ncbi:hypothetical protein FJZ19_05685 [Candidatus Pacearchaeota archaeon]|nr:hypothetical protein [Candidatus Pacearchaeota archaeon]
MDKSKILSYVALGLLSLSAAGLGTLDVAVYFQTRRIENLRTELDAAKPRLYAMIDEAAKRYEKEVIEPILQENREFLKTQREEVRRKMDEIVARNNRECEELERQCQEFDRSLAEFNKALAQ